MFESIRSKLFASFFMVLLIVLGLGGIAYYFTETTSAEVANVIDRDFNGSIAVFELAVLGQKIRRYEKEYFMYIGNAEKQNKYENEWTQTFNSIKEKLGVIYENKNGRWALADLNVFLAWEKSADAYGKGFKDVIRQVDEGKLTNTLDANAAVQDAKNAFRTFVNGTIEFANKKYADASVSQQRIEKRADLLRLVIIVSVASGVVLCMLLLTVVPRSITKPIKMLSEAADNMSLGNLDVQVPTKVGIKDFINLAQTLERMRVSQKAFLARM